MQQLLSHSQWFRTAFLSLCVLALAASLSAAFSSGSTGADGPLYVPATSGTATLQLPPDGKFHFTTVNIEAGATLKFFRNELNTPVYILATGDITINGNIDVSGQSGTKSPPIGGKGGPGGFDGGAPGIVGADPGWGYGPGGGKGGTDAFPNEPPSAGAGSFSAKPLSDDLSPTDGEPYGSALLVPMIGGSGGGGTAGQPGRGGGGGGGAILLASNTRITVHATGAIKAIGGNNQSAVSTGEPSSPAQGSGGAIRLVAPAVNGTGTLNANGGYSNDYYGTAGGAGRIRIDTLNRENLGIKCEPIAAASVGAFMAVFPTPMPRLDIIHAAGQDIPEGTGSAVQIILPFDSPDTQNITVQGRDFKGVVPIRIRVHPENGAPVIYDLDMDMGGNTVATVTQEVALPKNTVVSIFAWTR